jgi:hypothetical protein
VKASCQCGKLSAVIDDGVDALVVACHCIECQKRSGSPFGAIAYFPADTVAFHGEAREYTRPTDEGDTFTTGFCPTCGSTLYGLASKHPGIAGITVGTISDPSFPAPIRSRTTRRTIAMKARPWGRDHHVPVFCIEAHGSFGASGSPRCSSSIDTSSGDRTNAM